MTSIQLPIDVCEALQEAGRYERDGVTIVRSVADDWHMTVGPDTVRLFLPDAAIKDLCTTGTITCGAYIFQRHGG